MITSDGSIKPEGLPDYVVPPPSVLEPSEQNVVDNNIRTEQLIHEEESLVQFGNDTELVENDDGVKRNVFDFIEALILEPLSVFNND